MRIEEIEIHVGQPTGGYKTLGPIKAQVGAATIFSGSPTMDQVNQKLREEAVRMGANAVIEVSYDRGISMSSWKALTAIGTAVVLLEEPPALSEEQSSDPESRLLNLSRLKVKGLISAEEYEAKKRDILDSI